MNAPWTYFFSPAGPDRSVVSSNPATGAAVIRARISAHHVRGQRRGLRQARVDEPVRDSGAGHVGDQLPAPLHRDVLEDHQVDRQGPQPRPDRQGGVRHARRARPRHAPGRRRTGPRAGRAAPAPPARPGSPPAGRTGQPPGQRRPPGHAPHAQAPSREVVLGPVRDLPASSTRPGCPAASPASSSLRPLRGPPLLPRRLPPRQVIRARRHRGVPAVPRPRPQRRVQLLPQVSDHRLQRGDLLRLNGDLDELPVLRREPLRLLADQRITRILRQRRIGHSRQSSSRPQAAATAAPGPPPKRNRQSPGATQKARACMRAFRRGKLCRCLIRPGRRLTRSSTPPWP